MIDTERIARLANEVEVLDQLLLDLDPSTDRFWEVNAQREAMISTIKILGGHS